MKQMAKLFGMLAVLTLLVTSCGKADTDLPTVYFTRDISPEGLMNVYKALGVTPEGHVAVKISTGEPGGHNFLSPALIGDLVQSVAGNIVECNTAYAGRRYSTLDHYKAAEEHGFMEIASVEIMDAKGEIRIPVRDTTHLKYNIVGAGVANYDYMINIAHFKGHAMGGFGGVLKNSSIGVASANGKAYIHTAGKCETKEEMWAQVAKTEQDHFLESMAAAAQSVHDYYEGRMAYINVANNLSVDCDCDSHPADPEMNDIGIFASLDPVAVDQACVDAVFEYPSTEGDHAGALIERINSRHGVHILEHAAAIGLGSREYKLVEIK